MLKTRRLALALLVAAGAAAPACAQPVTLVLERVENFFNLISARDFSQNPPVGVLVENPAFVGGRLCSIETDGTSNTWFIGGYDNGGERPLNANWQVSAVKVSFDANLNRSFTLIPSSRNLPTEVVPTGSGEGILGMDFVLSNDLDAGGQRIGYLAMNFEIRNIQTYNRARVYNVTTQLNPILLTPSTPPAFTNPPTTRITTGPAWDWGPNGVSGGGFDYKTGLTFGAQDGNTDGPMILNCAFSAPSARMTDKERYDFDNRSPADSLPAGVYARADNNGLLFRGTALVPGSIGAFDTTDSLWRDLDVHPRTGVIAARASNTLRIVERSNSSDPAVFNTQTGLLKINGANAVGGVNNQRCNILHGANGGDLVIWNDRQTASDGQTFSQVIKFNRLTALSDANPCPDAGFTIVNPDGTPVTIAQTTGDDGTAQIKTGNGVYDFAWIESEGRLLVMDGGFSSRVYVFRVNPPANVCRGDLNGDGVVDPDDLADYIACFFGTPACSFADFNHDGAVDPDDLSDYIALFFSADPCL